jgi:hypothetical protein
MGRITKNQVYRIGWEQQEPKVSGIRFSKAAFSGRLRHGSVSL